MKNVQNFGLLAAVVFAVGMVGFNLSDGTFDLNQADSSAMASAGIMGHIEVIHTDSEGNILGYMQTDNAIANKGVNCTMVLLFGAATNVDQCNGAPGTFNVIAVDDTAFQAGTMELTSNRTTNQLRSTGFSPATADSVTITTVADGTVSATVDGVVRLTKVFTSTGAATIFGASLINSTTLEYGLFAYKDFGSSITLANLDQLTVNWDITIAGGGAESPAVAWHGGSRRSPAGSRRPGSPLRLRTRIAARDPCSSR